MQADSSPVTKPLPYPPIQQLTRPFKKFLQVQSSSGIVLVVCTAIALFLANFPPTAAIYHHIWEVHAVIGIGEHRLDLSIHHWINDALMTLFFFVVGLEIKRELVAGELSSFSKAALPVIAAAGGMVVPAGIYLALEYGQPGEHGWGIPMATDIAFVVGVLAVFGSRVPVGLKVFLLALAIVDDIGAILVIAVAYSASPDQLMLALAAGGFALMYLFNLLGVRTVGVYVVIGAGIWLAVLKSGVHPTIAGVLIGLLTPSRAWVGQTTLREAIDKLLGRLDEGERQTAPDPGHDDFQALSFAAKEATSPLIRLEVMLHPWVGFVIMPLFALANAGVAVKMGAIQDPIAMAVAAGLVLGKPIGIFVFSFLAVLLRIARLPRNVTWPMLAAAGCLGGIGFTMSLFIANLALDREHMDAGKIGILIGSGISVVIGCAGLVASLRAKPE